jgi:hypothetical protein
MEVVVKWKNGKREKVVKRLDVDAKKMRTFGRLCPLS